MRGRLKASALTCSCGAGAGPAAAAVRGPGLLPPRRGRLRLRRGPRSHHCVSVSQLRSSAHFGGQGERRARRDPHRRPQGQPASLHFHHDHPGRCHDVRVAPGCARAIPVGAHRQRHALPRVRYRDRHRPGRRTGYRVPAQLTLQTSKTVLHSPCAFPRPLPLAYPQRLLRPPLPPPRPPLMLCPPSMPLW
jgi:hypothetical protein